MNTYRLIVEARCHQCAQVWGMKDVPDPKRAGEAHAAETGHEVRIVETRIVVLNHNGEKEKATK